MVMRCQTNNSILNCASFVISNYIADKAKKNIRDLNRHFEIEKRFFVNLCLRSLLDICCAIDKSK